MSDITRNRSGYTSVHQARMVSLVELSVELCNQVLEAKGCFAVKVFQGGGFEESFKALKAAFSVAKTRQPDSSRARSRDVYLVASGFKL